MVTVIRQPRFDRFIGSGTSLRTKAQPRLISATSMSQPATNTKQIRVESLATFYSGLAAALSKAGFIGRQLNEIISKHVRGECVQCGIRITGEDLERITLAGEKTELPDWRLTRLRQGYCARKGCDSYHYRIHFDDYPNVDWSQIHESADSGSTVGQIAAEEVTSEGLPTNRKRFLIRLGLGIAVVLILLLFWHIRYYGYVPFVQKPHKYTIAPASGNNEASR